MINIARCSFLWTGNRMDGGICDTSHQMGPFCCRIYRVMNDMMIRLRLSSQMCDLPS
jgi:hypothetical protein